MNATYKFIDLPLEKAKDNDFTNVQLPLVSSANDGWTLKSSCNKCNNEVIWSWDESLNNKIHQEHFVRLPSLFAKRWDEDSFFELNQQMPNSCIEEINSLKAIVDDCDGGTFQIGMTRCSFCNSIILLQYRKGHPPEEKEQHEKKGITMEFRSIFFPDQSLTLKLYDTAKKPLPESWPTTFRLPSIQ